MSIAAKYRPYYTYDDYCQWEGRWELIEGMPYAMSPAPVPRHQIVGGNLYSLFKDALKKSGCKDCKPYPPIDWKIAEHTVVQPDLLIVCGKIDKKFLDFTPELVIEIASPSTASKDRGEKMELYCLQKVKYYLIVDFQFKKIEVWQFNDHQYESVPIIDENFQFVFAVNCYTSVSFQDIWE